MAAVYPDGIKTWTPVVDGVNDVMAQHINEAYEEIIALQQYAAKKSELTSKLDNGGDASEVTATFTQAANRTNLTSGEKLKISLGKLMKWFADLKTVAFTGSYNDLSNKPTIPSVLSQNTNVYVSTSGSDTTGDGTSGNPYRTIGKALSSTPQNLGGFYLNIYIGQGTYTEDITVNKFNGTVNFRGTSGQTVTIDGGSITVDNRSVLRLDTVNFNIQKQTSSAAVSVRQGSSLIVTTSLTVGTGGLGTGVWIYYNSWFFVGDGGSIQVNNCNTGIQIAHNSFAYLETASGTSNTIGMRASRGGMISYNPNGFSIQATNSTATEHGGRIYAGTQTSVPNY